MRNIEPVPNSFCLLIRAMRSGKVLFWCDEPRGKSFYFEAAIGATGSGSVSKEQMLNHALEVITMRPQSLIWGSHRPECADLDKELHALKEAFIDRYGRGAVATPSLMSDTHFAQRKAPAPSVDTGGYLAGFLVDVPLTLTVAVRGTDDGSRAMQIARAYAEALPDSSEPDPAILASLNLPAGLLITEVSFNPMNGRPPQVLADLEAEE